MPLICEAENWCFIHVPKTGGTSIYIALGHGQRRDLKIVGTRHTPLNKAFIRDGFFTFGFTRNPWERMVATWWHFAHSTGGKQQWKPYVKRAGFKKWIFQQEFEDAPPDVKRTIPVTNDPDARSNSRFKWMGHARTPSLRWLQGCKFIGRFETLESDFLKAQRKGRFTAPFELKFRTSRVSVVRNKHYREFYDDETREEVAKWHRADIERFGYEF